MYEFTLRQVFGGLYALAIICLICLTLSLTAGDLVHLWWEGGSLPGSTLGWKILGGGLGFLFAWLGLACSRGLGANVGASIDARHRVERQRGGLAWERDAQ